MMIVDRREFIKLAGFAALGLSGTLPAGLVRDIGAAEIKTGIRWAMVIDIKKCLENDVFDACVQACRKVHNIPEIKNSKHEIKWIWTEKYEHAFHEQHHKYTDKDFHDKSVLLLCNHCDDPPCVRVCPTQSTWKRADGIVMMDMHRCIGCRYCMAACPYGSRSFNWFDPRKYLDESKLNPEYPTRTKGVVEKCTFCAERLVKGLKPACVEACHNDELIFGNLNESHSKIRKVLEDNYTIRRKPSLGTNPQIYYIV